MDNVEPRAPHRILFLDDDPKRRSRFRKWIDRNSELGFDVTYTSTYEEAVRALDDGPVFDTAHLDHDLSEAAVARYLGGLPPDPNERNGNDVVTHILEKVPEQCRPRVVIVHSYNEDAGPAMVERLLEGGVFAVYEKFGY